LTLVFEIRGSNPTIDLNFDELGQLFATVGYVELNQLKKNAFWEFLIDSFCQQIVDSFVGVYSQ